MARRKIGEGTTDNNGRITVSYTGTGAGKLQLVAVNGNLVSETYTLYDSLFNGKNTTTGWYGNVEVDSGRVKWTVPSTNKYAGCNDATILAGGIGQTITTSVKVSSERNLRLSAYYYDNTWVPINNVFIAAGETNLTTLTSTIPTEASRIWVRLQSNSSSDVLDEGDIIYIDEFYTFIG